uniref:Uncharacterized protein n=1 Tax=uncultured bacterium A1Q1_fos_2116 TaxID=1256564 RepID=L7VWN2_9BACT|nr:hypothetical protein [uncultured bacterium A1Q1_fos_2116]
MAEFVPAVGHIISLIERGDWIRLEADLAPEVHWVNAVEEHFHGPTEVIAGIRNDPPPGPPAFHELDADGRLLHWIDKSG